MYWNAITVELVKLTTNIGRFNFEQDIFGANRIYLKSIMNGTFFYLKLKVFKCNAILISGQVYLPHIPPIDVMNGCKRLKKKARF